MDSIVDDLWQTMMPHDIGDIVILGIMLVLIILLFFVPHYYSK